MAPARDTAFAADDADTAGAGFAAVVTQSPEAAPSPEAAEQPARATDPTGSGGGIRGGGDHAAGGGGGERPPASPGRAQSWWRAERLLPHGLRAVTTVPFIVLVLIVLTLVLKAWKAIRFNGFGFFTHTQWNIGATYSPLVTTHGIAHPPEAAYGALPLIVGTLVSSAIAVVLAVPVAIGTALIVVEKLPPRISSAVGFCLEVLAGVPSVVFGLWGALTLGPFLAHHIAPIWADHIPDVPVLRFFKAPTYGGYGLFTTGVVLAVMILPIIAATTRDLLRQVPRGTVEGAVALGMTESEALGTVTIPWVRAGVIGATVLGLGRALGETIAVTMVSGSLTVYPHSLYSSFGTIAANILNTLDSAFGDASGLATSSLAELALVLLVITLLANIGARLLVRRVATTALPVGRGI